MDRRDTIKSMLLTTLGGGLVLQACDTEQTKAPVIEPTPEEKGGYYGRTPEEMMRDAKLDAETFFNDHELETIAVLSDIILPDFEDKGSASSAGVAQFIEFMAKDIPRNQGPLRGGIMWLDNLALKNYNKEFISCNNGEQIALVDQIAYPDKADPALGAGVKFFSLMRDLTLSGYYTSEKGLKEDLGYKGNMPGIWDGVPEDVLKDHGLEYPADWIPKFVDQSKRDVQAEWDDEGNLLT